MGFLSMVYGRNIILHKHYLLIHTYYYLLPNSAPTDHTVTKVQVRDESNSIFTISNQPSSQSIRDSFDFTYKVDYYDNLNNFGVKLNVIMM